MMKSPLAFLLHAASFPPTTAAVPIVAAGVPLMATPLFRAVPELSSACAFFLAIRATGTLGRAYATAVLLYAAEPPVAVRHVTKAAS